MQTLLIPKSSCLQTFPWMSKPDVFSTRDEPIKVKSIPYRLTINPLPCGIREAASNELPEVILLNDRRAARLIEFQIADPISAIVPVIDAAGYQQDNDNAQRADVRIATASQTCISQAMPKIIPMIERLHILPKTIFSTSDRRLHLLARLFVRGGGLTPRYDSSRSDLLHYQDAKVIPDLIQHAEALADLGALDRSVFETLTLCPACGSARLLTRPTTGHPEMDSRHPVHCIDCHAEHAAAVTTSKTFYSYHLTENPLENRLQIET